MATVEAGQRVLPAYVTYGTFANFIGKLNQTGLPSRIDKSVMDGMAGGVQSHLASSLRFLGLVDEGNVPTKAISDLITAKGDEKAWPGALRGVVERAYKDVLLDLDLTKATPSQLSECFRKNSELTGATLDKAIRFYLQAMKEAQVPHGTHLANMRVKTTSKPSKKDTKPLPASVASATEVGGHEHKADHAGTAHEMMTFPIYFKGKPSGKIIVPNSIAFADCKMIGIALQMIEAYAGSNDDGEHD